MFPDPASSRQIFSHMPKQFQTWPPRQVQRCTKRELGGSEAMAKSVVKHGAVMTWKPSSPGENPLRTKVGPQTSVCKIRCQQTWRLQQLSLRVCPNMSRCARLMRSRQKSWGHCLCQALGKEFVALLFPICCLMEPKQVAKDQPGGALWISWLSSPVVSQN